MEECASYAALSFPPRVRGDKKDDKWWSEQRWVIRWSHTDRWWDRERENWGGDDGTCSFIRPFTPVATATCLEGTQERRHHWQKQQRSRKWARASESKLDPLCVWMRAERAESRQQIYNWLRLLVLIPQKKCEEFDLQGTRLRSVMSIHSSLEVVQINVWMPQLKFHQQRLRPCLRVWISLIYPVQ